VYLATSAEVAQTTGEYFVKKAQRSLRGPANHDAVIEAAMTATWQIIERATRASE
jgi:uncharacterized protein (DUF2345 family)